MRSHFWLLHMHECLQGFSATQIICQHIFSFRKKKKKERKMWISKRYQHFTKPGTFVEGKIPLFSIAFFPELWIPASQHDRLYFIHK